MAYKGSVSQFTNQLYAPISVFGGILIPNYLTCLQLSEFSLSSEPWSAAT